MKLTRKLVLALVGGFMAVLIASAWISVRRQAMLFDSDMRRDHVVLGHALAHHLGTELVDLGERLARARAGTTLGPREQVRIRWLSMADPEVAHALALEERARLAAGNDVSTRVREPGADADTLYTYVPITPGQKSVVEIAESLGEERQFLAHTIRNAVWSTLVLLVITGALASLVGGHFVSRPIRAILEKIRRVAAGDLSGDMQITQRDELGAIALALNEMSAGIARAQEKLEAETRARIAAVEQLRHADRLMTVGKLASGLAHELGTPLSVISGRAEMTLLSENQSAEARESARIIRDQTQRMTAIIRQLLDFARKRAPQKNLVDMRALAERTLTLLRPLAEKKQLELTLRPTARALETSVDEAQMQQVLTNLIANALQATPGGGTVTVELRGEHATPPVDVGGSAGPMVRVSVADTGCGMSPEVQARIFEPFFTTKEVGEGTGLGLSVAYGIVREHGGWIAVDSTVGRGSTFSVYVPTSERRAAA
jgi:signal transduction histidine kinase